MEFQNERMTTIIQRDDLQVTVVQIASRLVLSVKTVDAHKTNLMRKLDLHDRSEVIKYANQRKLIRLPSMKTEATPAPPPEVGDETPKPKFNGAAEPQHD